MRLSLITLAAVITGCASPAIDNLPSSVAQSQPDQYGKTYIEKVVFNEQAETGMDDLAFCISSETHDKDVHFGDASRSFVGAYSGSYYEGGNSYSDTGNDGVIAYRDNSRIVSNAKISYTTGTILPSASHLKYKLKSKLNDSAIVFEFTDIERVAASTGVMQNTGFKPVGTWPGALPLEFTVKLKTKKTKSYPL